jgi:hypothetical protein
MSFASNPDVEAGFLQLALDSHPHWAFAYTSLAKACVSSFRGIVVNESAVSE